MPEIAKKHQPYRSVVNRDDLLTTYQLQRHSQLRSAPRDAIGVWRSVVRPRTKSDDDRLSEWLDGRLSEVEENVGGRGLPSVAVLVNDEARVGPLASFLHTRLARRNLSAVACPEGRTLGERSEVRVFDVQHIKGLEFEAVFLSTSMNSKPAARNCSSAISTCAQPGPPPT